MALELIERLLAETDSLSDEELEQLVRKLQDRARNRHGRPRLSWREVRGIMKTPPGFDAQEWISRERAEAERRIPGFEE